MVKYSEVSIVTDRLIDYALDIGYEIIEIYVHPETGERTWEVGLIIYPELKVDNEEN